MKFKLRNTFKNKLFRLTPLLLVLSGCTSDVSNHEDFAYVKPNVFGIPNIPNAWRDITFGNVERINNYFYNLRADAVNDAFNNMRSVFSAINSIEVMPLLINAVAILGVTVIIIRFFWIVFKSYLLNFGEEDTPVTFSLIKRTVMAALFVFVAPYIIINGFILSTLVSAQVVSYIGLDIQDETTETTVLQDLAITPIDLTTYCAVEGADVPETSFNYPLDKKIDSILLNNYNSTLTNSEDFKAFGNDLYGLSQGSYRWTVLYPYDEVTQDINSSGYFMGKMYDKYCVSFNNKKPYSVAEAVFTNPALGEVDADGSTQPALIATQGGIGFAGFLAWLFIMAFTGIALVQTASRIGELIISIVATPFFAMQYLSMGDSKSMQTWVQEITSIFLTHIVTVIGFVIGVVEITKAWTGSTILVAGGLIWVMMKGPQIVRNWSNATGAGGAAGSAARGAMGLFKGR